MNEAPQDSRMPRGVLAVVAVGLIATLAAALLATGKGEGEAAHLEFVQLGKVPDSASVAVPGGKGTIQLTEGRIQATGTNYSGYSMFRVATTLNISKGAPIGGGRILCETSVKEPSTEIGQSSNSLRTLYPRSSEDGIWGQPIPETLLVQFSSHNSELAVLEVADVKQERFTTIQGVKLEWPEYAGGPGRLKYFLPDGKPKVDVELPFYSVWKAQTKPAAKIACTLETSAGEATVKTDASLPKISPPINEEAEEENAERREEVEEEEEEEAEG
jgi:hypothetical protein